MALNVLRFKHQGRAQWGVVRDGRITPVPGDFPTTRAFLDPNPLESLARSERTDGRRKRCRTSVAGHRRISSSSARARTTAST